MAENRTHRLRMITDVKLKLKPTSSSRWKREEYIRAVERLLEGRQARQGGGDEERPTLLLCDGEVRMTPYTSSLRRRS